MKQRKRTRRGRGEGSIYRRKDGLYVGAIVLSYDREKKRSRRRVVYGTSKTDVQAKLMDLQQKARVGLAEVSTLSIAGHLDHWLDSEVKPRVDASTLTLYRQRVEDFIKPHLGPVAISKLTPFHVADFYKNLEGAGLSADLRNKVGAILRRSLTHAVDLGMIHSNPSSKVTLPRVDTGEMHPLDEQQAKAFLAEAEKHRLYPLFLLALDSGMRQGELLALEWADIDFATGIVTVTKTVQLHNGHHKVKKPKTAAGTRRLRITSHTVAILQKRREHSKWPLVFPNRRGRYLQRENIRRALRSILERASLHQIRFHDLRHTQATLALLKTKNIKAVSSRLGHHDIAVTLNTYSHYLPVMEEEMVAAMEEIVTPSVAPSTVA